MKRRIPALAALLIVPVLLSIAATPGPETSAPSHDDDGVRRRGGTIAGQVTDPSGRPLEGVSVGIPEGLSALTDVGGRFELTGVRQRKRIVVDFRKAGYASTQAVTALKLAPGSDEDEADDGEGHKLERVTLNRTMLPSGAAQPLDASAPGTIAEEGFKVTFPAGSLNADGTVEVAVSPIDVSTGELLALPGDFSGRARDGSRVLLEASSLMSVSLTQNGRPVNLRPGATATLELLLPADTPLAPGEAVPLWFYSEKQGTWVEEGHGTVGTSTSVPGRLSVTGDVGHFSWWGLLLPVHPSEQTCLTGGVTDSNGEPESGVYVLAEGVEYRWASRAVTDAAGRYCVMVKRESLVRVKAFLDLGGAYATPGVEVATPEDQSLSCIAGDASGCAAIPPLRLPPVSCVRGDVRDALDNPIAGLRVFSSAGTSATTDAAGAFCLGAPGGSVVSVHAPGYPSATVTTPNAEGSCAVGGCAVVAIRPAPSPTPTPTPTPSPTPAPTPTPTPDPGLACLQVSATYFDGGSPAASTTVHIYDDFGNLLMSAVTDAAGRVCFENLPVETHVFLHASDGRGQSAGTDASTGAGGGGCSQSSCVQVVLVLSQGS